MKVNNIIGSSFGTLEISTNAETWNIRASARIVADFVGVLETFASIGNAITISGTIAALDGVVAEGDNVDIHIGRTAIISAVSSGVTASGLNSFVKNEGQIFAHGSAGVQVLASSEAHNAGYIAADIGMVGAGDGYRLVNEKNGIIEARDAGFRTVGVLEGGSVTIINHGIVRVQDTGVFAASFLSLTAANETITNDGRMIGDIFFGSGNDTLDIRGGFLKGNIIGDRGDDTLITDNAKYTLTEDADRGFDTVRSIVTYTLSANVELLRLLGSSNIDGTGTGDANDIVGNNGGNVLRGFEGADILRGGKGNDRLFGGGADASADRFDFNTRDGHDIIADFEDGFDFVDLTGWKAIRDFEDLLNNHTHFVGGDAIIVAGNDLITIRGLSSLEFDRPDFIFAP